MKQTRPDLTEEYKTYKSKTTLEIVEIDKGEFFSIKGKNALSGECSLLIQGKCLMRS